MKVPKGEEAIELQVEEIQKIKVELQRRQVEEIQDRQLFDTGTTGKPAGYQKEKRPNKTKKSTIYSRKSKKAESRRNRGLKNVSVFYACLLFTQNLQQNIQFFQNHTLK